MSGLVGFELADGRLVCVDCDVYPCDSTDIRLPATGECDFCGQALDDVDPVGNDDQ